MAIRICEECGKEIGTDAAICTHCGSPGPASRGSGFEWRSRANLFGIPLIHVAFGRDNTGRMRVAKGFVAIGQLAVGLITIAQFGIGVIFGFGQFVTGLTGIGQVALAVILGIGQFATGLIAIGQVVLAVFGLAQAGWATYLWSPDRVDMEAVAMFHTLLLRFRSLFGL